MGYLHIDNLYKNREILMFRECYAMEKIHGTSAHVAWNSNRPDEVRFQSGGAKHETFVSIFDKDTLLAKFKELGTSAIVYGEAYGGSMQGMKDTYGDKLKFVAFEVQIDNLYLEVPKAEQIVRDLGLEFVYYKLIPTDLDCMNAERDAESVQAIRNGCGPGKQREGIVLRPVIEVRKNNGDRIIAKHKCDTFRETKTPRDLHAVELVVMSNDEKVADEWVTHMRLSHVLDKMPGATITDTKKVMKAMYEDIMREADGEVIFSREVERAINRATSRMFTERCKRID